MRAYEVTAAAVLGYLLNLCSIAILSKNLEDISPSITYLRLMNWIDRLRDLLRRKQAERLIASLPRVCLQTERVDPERGTVYYPAPKYHACIEINDESVGLINFAINPLNDRLYINWIEIFPRFRRRNFALAALWQLHRAKGLPIVPVAIFSSLEAQVFWREAQRVLGYAGARIEDDMPTSVLLEEQYRWRHLVPEQQYERNIRELLAAAEQLEDKH